MSDEVDIKKFTRMVTAQAESDISWREVKKLAGSLQKLYAETPNAHARDCLAQQAIKHLGIALNISGGTKTGIVDMDLCNEGLGKILSTLEAMSDDLYDMHKAEHHGCATAPRTASRDAMSGMIHRLNKFINTARETGALGVDGVGLV